MWQMAGAAGSTGVPCSLRGRGHKRFPRRGAGLDGGTGIIPGNRHGWYRAILLTRNSEFADKYGITYR